MKRKIITMPTVTIDGKKIDVPSGTTILEAAERLGIKIPTMCYKAGYEPNTSCLVCVVKIAETGRVVPACATRITEPITVESETSEVRQLRRMALELLLSDHAGDCIAPCQLACPAHMNIPLMLRQIAEGDFDGAIRTVKRDIALPGVLGRVCQAPCESACRRRSVDEAVSICLLKRFVADADFSTNEPFLPVATHRTGRSVAIVGSGAAGLAAAWHLAQLGHAVTVFEAQHVTGGTLREIAQSDNVPGDTLAVLEQEIRLIEKLGVRFQVDHPIDGRDKFEEILAKFDAVLLACGAGADQIAKQLGLETTRRGINVSEGYQTNIPAVFAAGKAVRGKAVPIRSLADGKEAAECIAQYLTGIAAPVAKKPYTVRMGRLAPEELQAFVASAENIPRELPGDILQGYLPDQARGQARRCLHCDCARAEDCKLRRLSEQYGANPARYQGQRRQFQRIDQAGMVVFEPGKCINCGLCVQITAQAREPLGLTFIGRGFDIRVGVPFGQHLHSALQKTARDVVAACPTAALVLKSTTSGNSNQQHGTGQ